LNEEDSFLILLYIYETVFKPNYFEKL